MELSDERKILPLRSAHMLRTGAAILISTCNKVGAWQQHMASPLLQKLEGHKSSPSSDG